MKVALAKRKKILIDRNTILLFVILFISGDTYLCGTNSNETVLTIARVSAIFLIVFIMFRMNFRLCLSQNKGKICAYLAIVVAFIGISIFHQDNINIVVIRVIFMTLSLSLCLLFSFKEYVMYFNKVMYIIAVAAIVFTLLAYISPSLIRMFPSIINSANTRIYTWGLAGLLEGMLGQSFIRTQGIFWEPGVFQMYLNLAIAFEILYKEHADKKKIIVYVVALLFTFSTTGYIVFAWILISYMFFVKNKNGKEIAKKFIVIMIIFFAGVVVLQFTTLGDSIFGKIVDKDNANFGSMTTRMAGILVSCKIAIANPLVGIGINSMSDSFFYVSYALRELLGGWTSDNTNTLFYQFAAHGIPYGLLFLIGTYKFGKCFENGKSIVTMVVFIMLFLMYIGENLQYSIFPYIIIFYGYGWKESVLTNSRNISKIYNRKDKK